MSRNTWYYIGFFVVLLAAFYFFLFSGNDYWKVKLPVMGNVQSFSFLNQDGEVVTNEQTKGHVYVSAYFFTTCRGICPPMNNNMKKVYEKYKGDTNFLILSHTAKPDTDSVPVMKRYADSMKVDIKRWWFLTGEKSDLYYAARNSYRVDDEKNPAKIENDFIHTQLFALVDKLGRLRGIYDGLNEKELYKLMKDIQRLLEEN